MSDEVDPAQATAWRRWAMQCTVVLGVGTLLYLGLVLHAGWRDIVAALEGFSLGGGLGVLGLILLGWLLRGLRWHYYTCRVLESRDIRSPRDGERISVPLLPNLLAFAASFAFTATPGKVGEAIKSLLLNLRYDVPITATAGALMIERLMDLFALLLLSTGGLSLADVRFYFLASLVLLVGIVLFVVIEPLHRGVLDTLGMVPVLRRVSTMLIRLLASGRLLLRPAEAMVGLSLAIVAWGLEVLAFSIILDRLGGTMPFPAAASIFGLATVVGALSMLPGGLGGFEATMLLLLTEMPGQHVLDPPEAIAATVLIRLATLWFVNALGGLAMLLWWSRYGKRRYDGGV